MINYTWEYPQSDKKLDPFLHKEVFRTLYTVTLKARNELIKENPKSTSQVELEASPAVVVALQSLDGFVMDNNADWGKPIHKAGSLDNITVYRDLTAHQDYIKVKTAGEHAFITVTGLNNL